MSKSKMKSSTLRLSDIAKEVAMPKGVTSTGWPAVEAKARDFGVEFRPWQPGVGRMILAKRSDGKYAATIGGTGMSIPRQVGKTFIVGAIMFALCLLSANMTVIWTAHRLRTSEETFGKMQAFAKRKKIAPHVSRIVRGSGEEAIEFRNGSRILFGARERGFGRGFDEVDALVFDEAQILTEAALDDMIPATNQSRQPSGALLLFMGTPPKPTDPGEVFTRMRSEALTGEDDNTSWVEFGADAGFEPTPLPAPLKESDWDQVAKANPSFPHDTPREAIMRMRKNLGPESFFREGLGVWDDPNRKPGAFGRGKWEECAGPMPDGVDLSAVGIAASIDMTHAAIVGAGVDDEIVHVKPIQHGPGTGWVVQKALEVQEKHGVEVIIDGRGPGAALIPALENAGVRLKVTKTTEVQDAYAKIHELVKDVMLRHQHYEELDKAVRDAVPRPIGDRYAWGRRQSSSDISPLEATTLAVWGVSDGNTFTSAYADTDLIII